MANGVLRAMQAQTEYIWRVMWEAASYHVAGMLQLEALHPGQGRLVGLQQDAPEQRALLRNLRRRRGPDDSQGRDERLGGCALQEACTPEACF